MSIPHAYRGVEGKCRPMLNSQVFLFFISFYIDPIFLQKKKKRDSQWVYLFKIYTFVTGYRCYFSKIIKFWYNASGKSVSATVSIYSQDGNLFLFFRHYLESWEAPSVHIRLKKTTYLRAPFPMFFCRRITRCRLQRSVQSKYTIYSVHFLFYVCYVIESTSKLTSRQRLG